MPARHQTNLCKGRRFTAVADEMEPIDHRYGLRGGDKHSNHGHTVEQMIRHLVDPIHNKYRQDVRIIIRIGSGFIDHKI